MSTTEAAVETAPLDFRLLPAAALCWLTTLFGILLGWRVALGMFVVLAVVAAAVFVAFRYRAALALRVGAGVIAALLLAAGFSLAVCVRSHASTTHPLAELGEGAYVTATVVLSDDPKPMRSPGGPAWVTVPAQLREIRIAAGASAIGGAVVVMAPADSWRMLLPGQEVEVRGSVRPPRHSDLTVAVIRATGPPRRLEAPSRLQRFAGDVRTRFAEAASEALPGAEGGLLPGLVVGDTSALPDGVREEFRAAGLSHLTAVSGANVAILLGAVLLSVRGLTLGPRTGVVLAALALAMFVVIARPSPSVLRAAVMGAVGLLALVTGRRKQAIPALATAVIVLLAVYPALAVDFGFALSVLATAGLILLAPTWADWLRARGVPRAAAEMLAVATAAFAVTTPVVAAMSGTVSTVSIVANLLVGVVIAPITVVGAIAAVLASVWFPAAVVVARCLGPPLSWLIWVAEQAAAFPGASITVPSGIPGAVLALSGVVAVGVGIRIAVGRTR